MRTLRLTRIQPKFQNHGAHKCAPYGICGALEECRFGRGSFFATALDCACRMLKGEAVTLDVSGMSKGEWREFEGVIGVSESGFDPPDWVLEKNGSPSISSSEGVDVNELFYLIGRISSEWSQVDKAVNQIVYCLIAAHDLERPNAKPIADAILIAHRSFDGKSTLAENLCAVVLVRQPNLRSLALSWLRKARYVAKHRNAIMHGTVVNWNWADDGGEARDSFCVTDVLGPNSFKAFPKKNDVDVDFEKTRTPNYDRDALRDVLEAVNQVAEKLIQCGIDPYMVGLSNGSILPSQGGNLLDDGPEPHIPRT